MRGIGRGAGVLFSMLQTAIVLTALALVLGLGTLGLSTFYPDLRCPAGDEKPDWRYLAEAINRQRAPDVPLASAAAVHRYLAAHPGCCTVERFERPGLLARVAAAGRGEDPVAAVVVLHRPSHGVDTDATRTERVLFDLCGKIDDPQ